MKSVFSIAPSRIGGLDMLLPIFFELKYQTPKIKIYILINEYRTYVDLLKNEFLREEVFNIVDHIYILEDEKGVKSIIWKAIRILPFLFKIATTPGFILLHSRDFKSKYIRLIYLFRKLIQGEVYEHLSGMFLLLDRKPQLKKPQMKDQGDGFLTFSIHDNDYLRALGRRNLIPIGYPRLYENWQRYLKQMGQDYVQRILLDNNLDINGAVICLFLGSTVPNIYEEDELRKWIFQAIDVIKSNVMNHIILVKPHPMQNMKTLKIFLDELNSSRVVLTELHPGILSVSARCVIACHSSTIIDALAAGTPTIQFQNFTKKWLNRHPEGSSYLKLGALWARNRKELEEKLLQALSIRYSVPDILLPLQHKMDLSVFLR